MKAIPDLAEYVDHFRARVLQDALAEATASYWTRRARVFDEVGTEACRTIAQACRNRAALAQIQDAETGPEGIVCEFCGTRTSPWSCSCGETRLGAAA